MVTLRDLTLWALDITGVNDWSDLPQEFLELVELFGVDNPLDPGTDIDFGATETDSAWTETTFVKYDGGPKFNQKRTFPGWTKPYNDMTDSEKKAYWWGHYTSYVKGEQKSNKAFKRGFTLGAKQQQRADREIGDGKVAPLQRYG